MADPDFVIKRGDRLPPLVATLYDAGNSRVNLSSVTTVTLALKLPGASDPIFFTPMSPDPDQNANPGRVTYNWADGDTDVPGLYDGEIVVAYSTLEQTYPTLGYFSVLIVADLESS